jgi:dipeptidyl aminopeptidase/acylaminoacyl peptidase
MKQAFTHAILLLIVAIAGFGFTVFNDQGKVHLKVTREENGEKSVFEKSYESMEALKADSELQAFDVLVEKWASDLGLHAHEFDMTSDDGKKVMIKRRMDETEVEEIIQMQGDGAWTSDDGDTHVIIKKKDGKTQVIDIKEDKVTKIRPDDGQHEIVRLDEDGKTSELADEKIEELAQVHKEDGAEVNITKKVEVITSNDGEDTHKVIIKKVGVEDSALEIEIEEEVENDGEIVDKKVWITKDGNKVELEGDNTFEFETEGKKVKIIVTDEALESADFSRGKSEGKKAMVIAEKDGEADKQYMNVNIEEENGESFINIDIKRNAPLNVTISDISKADASMQDVSFSLKNTLKPSDLNYYPNPGSGKFNLKFNLEDKDEVTVRVMDILGKEVYKETIPNFDGIYTNQLNLIGYEKGVYVLQILQNKNALSRKILIE